MYKGIRLSASVMCMDWLNVGKQLKEIEGIKFIYLSGLDVIRHSLVQRIIQAYEKTI